MPVRSARTLESRHTAAAWRQHEVLGPAKARILVVAAFAFLAVWAVPDRAAADEIPAAAPARPSPAAAVSIPLPENQVCLECHRVPDYNQSSHRVVGCTACHEEVLSQTKEEHQTSSGSALAGHALRLELSERCGKCHAGAVLETYQLSFHRAALDLGGRSTAACADCHPAHTVLPASDPRSSVAPANLPATCGQQGCHSGAGAAFVAGKVHSSPLHQGPWSPVRIIWKAFIVLILFDTLKDGPIVLFELARRLRRRRPAEPPAQSLAAEVGKHVSN